LVMAVETKPHRPYNTIVRRLKVNQRGILSLDSSMV
jgi:hypothetical protein